MIDRALGIQHLKDDDLPSLHDAEHALEEGFLVDRERAKRTWLQTRPLQHCVAFARKPSQIVRLLQIRPSAPLREQTPAEAGDEVGGGGVALPRER